MQSLHILKTYFRTGMFFAQQYFCCFGIKASLLKIIYPLRYVRFSTSPVCIISLYRLWDYTCSCCLCVRYANGNSSEFRLDIYWMHLFCSLATIKYIPLLDWKCLCNLESPSVCFSSYCTCCSWVIYSGISRMLLAWTKNLNNKFNSRPVRLSAYASFKTTLVKYLILLSDFLPCES